jgi:hypothetical protein
MKIHDTLDGIIHLPRKLHDVGTMSIVALLKEASYFEIHDQISVDDIRMALIQCPECIDEWMLYSEDKRTSSGWYFLKEGVEKYIVGYSARNKGHNITEKYSDRFDACAHFIKYEIDGIIARH